MTPFEAAKTIVAIHVPDGSGVHREALTEAIRWAIVQAEIAVRQPAEFPPSLAGTIAYQVVYFIDNEILDRLRGASYAELANALQACRTRVLAQQGMEPRKRPVGVEGSELRRKAQRA